MSLNLPIHFRVLFWHFAIREDGEFLFFFNNYIWRRPKILLNRPCGFYDWKPKEIKWR